MTGRENPESARLVILKRIRVKVKKGGEEPEMDIPKEAKNIIVKKNKEVEEILEEIEEYDNALGNKEIKNKLKEKIIDGDEIT